MREFREFKFKWTYIYAETVRNVVIEGDNGLINIQWYFEGFGDHFYELILKPHKKTLLHHFIEDVFLSEMDYFLKKAGEEMYPEIYALLETYNVPYSTYDDFHWVQDPVNHKHLQYRDYIIKILTDYVVDDFVAEIFTVLYQDKVLLMKFNERVADQVVRGNQLVDGVFKAQGVVHRYSKWPQWLRNGIYFRDKGRCGICLCDLSGELAVGNKLAIDHIVPLKLGGANDPTNLQQLCPSCNSGKGGHTITTRNNIPLYW